MKKEFSVGDKVKRVQDSYAGMKVGDVGTVVEVSRHGTVMLKEYQKNGLWHDPNNLELAAVDNWKEIIV